MPFIPDNIGDIERIPNPDPARHYRWISLDVRRLAQWQMSYGERPGYQLEQGKTVAETRELAKRLGYPDTIVNELTNRIQMGDRVLASIPIEEYNHRIRELSARSQRAAQAAEDRILGTEIRGVTPVRQDVKEHEDRKRHAQRESTNRVGWTPPPTTAT